MCQCGSYVKSQTLTGYYDSGEAHGKLLIGTKTTWSLTSVAGNKTGFPFLCLMRYSNFVENVHALRAVTHISVLTSFC